MFWIPFLINAALSYAATKDPKQALLGGLVGGGIGSLGGLATKGAGALSTMAGGAKTAAALGHTAELGGALAHGASSTMGGAGGGILSALTKHPGLAAAGGLAALSAMSNGQPHGAPAPTAPQFAGFLPPEARTYNPISDEAALNYGLPQEDGEHKFFAAGGFIDDSTDGIADRVPAQSPAGPINLSGGEYIMPAKVVSAIGNGNSKAGAKVLDQMKTQVLRNHYKV